MGEFSSHAFLRKLWQISGKGSNTYREFASQIFAAVVPTAPLYSQAVATIVNFYLDTDKQAAREEIVKLVASQEEDAVDKVMGYVCEALRKSWAPSSCLSILIICFRLGSSRTFVFYNTKVRSVVLICWSPRLRASTGPQPKMIISGVSMSKLDKTFLQAYLTQISM
jgi:hypothetical protein